MVEQYNRGQNVRSYEVSIWTLQDRFLSVLKWAEMDQKGQIQDPEMILRDDGTQEFTFSIPQFYYDGDTKITNPLWRKLDDQPLEANMHKLKVIFNKNEKDAERIFEFLVTAVTEDHTQDNIMISVKAEGLAFHELGKIGYKISLSQTNFELDEKEWFDNGAYGTFLMNIQYWNNKIFLDSDGNKRTNWDYEIQMDWSSFSNQDERDTHKVYEDEYVSSWELDENGSAIPRAIKAYDEKEHPIEVSESNLYNITQTIAEQFNVFCRYEYEHDDNYQICGRKVIYYNNYIKDMEGHVDLTYPYDSTAITRTVDNTDLITKMYVHTIEQGDDTITIMDVDANKSKEDYLLNFDYLYKIGAITQEQYDEIENYTNTIRFYNEQLISYSERIRILTNQLIDIEAEVTTATNALMLDREQINNAEALQRALTTGTDYIEISNHAKGVLDGTDKGYGKYIKLTEQGIDINTVLLYNKTDYKGTYDDLISGWRAAVDEYNNVIRIENINTDNDIVYITGKFSPYHYYQTLLEVWHKREAIDKISKEEAENKYKLYNWYIYGGRAEYNQVDPIELDSSYSGLAIVSGPQDSPYTSTGGYITNIVDECRILANSDLSGITIDPDIGYPELKDYFINVDENNATPDLQYNYDKILAEKERLINKFERMMGPALREGYWQPENYKDYGDVYTDGFIIYPSQTGDEIEKPTADTDIIQSEHLQFMWDNGNFYENESPLIYQSGVDGAMSQHIIIELKPADLDKISKQIDSLYFIYYNEGAIERLRQLRNAIAEDTEPMLSTHQAEYDNIIASGGYRTIYSLMAQCELGWIIKQGSTTPIPVIIVTGAKSLPNDSIRYIVTGKYQSDGEHNSWTDFNARPYIGTYESVIVGTEIKINSTVVLDNLTFFGEAGTLDESLKVNLDGNLRWPKGNEYTVAQRVFPRLYFNTLKLKNNTYDLRIKLNSRILTDLEEYYTNSDDRSVGINTMGVGYYTTIKPEALFALGNTRARIDIVYTLSNVDVSIYLDAVKVMKENAFPKVTYDVELSILNPKFIHTTYDRLNQIVHINDNDLRLENVNGYISEVNMKLDKPWEDTVQIKNYETKFEDLFTTIVAQTEAIKKSEGSLNAAIQAFSYNGLIDNNVIKNSIANADLDYSFNQGTLRITQNDGIWGESNAGRIVFRGGGIFTATEQDANGNWKWNTGILPSGINANLITAGQLDTNRIKIYAGDQLRFQWDGDGLYAYKPVINAGQANNGVDYLQYVVYNPEGLFLVAEKGAIYQANEDDDNPIYKQNNIGKIPRVEVSWKGLILRNWNGDDVFYADPDSGNLYLTGHITAISGEIGGWTITEDSLFKDGIILCSTGDKAGIYLSDQPIQTIETIIDGKAYYLYHDQTGNSYYLDTFAISEVTMTADEIVYIKQEQVISVEPIYQVSKVTYQNGTITSVDTENGVKLSNTPTANTVIYVGEDAATPMTYNGQSIVYNFDNTPNADTNTWYQQVLSAKPNPSNYIKETKGWVYTPIEVKDIVGEGDNSTLTLIPDAEGETTFSVFAKDGKATIKQGTIGDFTIEKNALQGGTLLGTKIDNSSYFTANGKDERFDKLFYDIQADSTNGVLTLTRINGEQVNFNIAAMPAYQNAVAAAAQITLELISQDGMIIATATNNKGVTVTKQVGVSSVGSGIITARATSGNGVVVERQLYIQDGGADIGIQPTGCGSGCTTDCKGKCGNTCQEKCKTSCGTACQKGCGGNCVNICRDDCTTGCEGGCQNTCQNGCYTSCVNICQDDCTTGCTRGCRATCYGGCRYTSKSGGGCFTPLTLITLSNREAVPIFKITKGMELMAYDETQKIFSTTIVNNVMKFNKKDIVDIILANGNKVTTTQSHPFLTNKGWKAIDTIMGQWEHNIAVQELHIGDFILTENNNYVKVIDIISREDLDNTEVYNIDVTNYSTYLANGLIVHNADKKDE